MASCIHFSEVNSIYWWKNNLEESTEVKLVIKTSIDLEMDILNFVESAHSYSLPELIVIKASCSNEYMQWMYEAIS